MGAGVSEEQSDGQSRIVLANEPDFQFGRLLVRPSIREVSFENRKETLEPRVMQVLVALARAKKTVLSRYELVEQCWDGLSISDDAINRPLSRLRQVARDIGGDTFKVETIRGVGYRLVEIDPENGEAFASQLNPEKSGPSRRNLIIAGAASGITALGGYAFWLGRPVSTSNASNAAMAREFFKRGMESRGQASLIASEQGAAMFREATRLDPSYAAAWGALAWSYRGLLEFGPRPDADRIQALSRSAAARALELDSRNVEAQAALLLLKPFYQNWKEIEQGLRDLSADHPQNSLLEYNLGFLLCETGRWRQAVGLFRSTKERDPFWPIAYLRLILALQSSGLIEEAEDIIEEGMERFPRRKDFWLLRARYLAVSGQHSEAQNFTRDLARRPATGNEPAIDFEVRIIDALASGSRAERDAALETLMVTAKEDPKYLPTAAVSACILGDNDRSFDMLAGYYFGRGTWAAGKTWRRYTDLLFLGSTAALRRDPRFAGLTGDIGLQSFWSQTGTVPDYIRYT
jgi:DNA-binding winged helix-turn-helix (wHTH) protein/tetratricopeptide (TPR) repeat protein